MDTKMKSLVSPNGRKAGLLKDQLQLVKRKEHNRYEILPIEESLSFEKGLYIFVRACQLLAQKMDGVIFVGLAGASGAGKTVFCEKLIGFMPGIATISMDNYNDSSRLIDENYDDPRLTDYDLLLQNINELKAGKDVEIPIYDFKLSRRVGYRCLKVPPSRIVVIEGIYALSEKLRPFLDLRVAVKGGVHFDLVKRVLRDINRAGQEPEEIIHQISETVYPMYKAFIEPDLGTAHIKIINKFNPFSGFQNPTYILKSAQPVSEEKIRLVLSPNHAELNEETYDIYLLPPGEDPETCQSYLRMRNRDGKYSLMFEEIVVDDPFLISPRITFEVSVRLLGGLMALGYTITTILKRSSHVFSDEKLCIKIDKLEQLQRNYVQIQGKDRNLVAEAGKSLGLDGSYIPHSYIEQIQREKLISGLVGPSEDLKTKLSLHEDVLSPRPPTTPLSKSLTINKKGVCQTVYSKSLQWEQNESKDVSFSVPTGESRSQHNRRKFAKKQMSLVVSNGNYYDERQLNSPAGYEGSVHLLEKLSSVNERLEEISLRLGNVESKLDSVSIDISSSQNSYVAQKNTLARCISQQSISSQLVSGNGNAPDVADPLLYEEVKGLSRGQQQLRQQLDMVNARLHDFLSDKQSRNQRNSWRYDDLFGITTEQFKTMLGLGALTVGFIIGVKALQRA